MKIVVCFCCKRIINKEFVVETEFEEPKNGMEGMMNQMMKLIKEAKGYDDVLDKIKSVSEESKSSSIVYLCHPCNEELLYNQNPDIFKNIPGFLGVDPSEYND